MLTSGCHIRHDVRIIISIPRAVHSYMSIDQEHTNSKILLILFMLCFTGWNGLRAGAAIVFWETLPFYNARASPPYLALSGVFWVGIGITLCIAVWKSKIWANSITFLIAVLYSIWYWCDRLVLQPVPHANWPFTLTVNILLLTFVLLTMYRQCSKLLINRGCVKPPLG